MSDTYPPLDQVLTIPPRSTKPVVSYGVEEPDPDAGTAYTKHFPTRRAAIDWYLDDLFGVTVEMYPVPAGYRRRRYEKWWQDGKRMGRWEWERRTRQGNYPLDIGTELC